MSIIGLSATTFTLGDAGVMAAGGAGLSMLGGLLGKKGSAPSVMEDTSYNQMMQNGQGGNFNQTSGNNATYLADMYSQLGTGRNPSYWQKYVNQAQPYNQNLMTQQFYGIPGNRGFNPISGGPSAMGQAQNMAAMYGLNPQAGIGQMNRVNQQYMDAENQINQYFMGQGINLMNTTAQNLPKYNTDYMNSLSEAFKPVFSNVIPGTPGTNPLAGIGSAMSSFAGSAAAGMGGNGGGGGTNVSNMGNIYGGSGSPTSMMGAMGPSGNAFGN